MIISCPSCQTSFRVDATRLGPNGKKVRCSKCGQVWRAVPDEPHTPEEAVAEKPQPDVSAEPGQPEAPEPEPEEPEQPAGRAEPMFTAHAPDDEDTGGAESAKEDVGGEESADAEEAGGHGLTGEQRAKLAAAQQKKQPRGARFWIKVLLIFVVVAGMLLVAQRMLPKPGMKKAGPVIEKPADIAPVKAKPVPADPGTSEGGHIVGGPLPTKSEQPAQ